MYDWTFNNCFSIILSYFNHGSFGDETYAISEGSGNSTQLMIFTVFACFHASSKVQMWQKVELLHSHLYIIDTEYLNMQLMGIVQATGTNGPVRTHDVIIDPGGEWTSERTTK